MKEEEERGEDGQHGDAEEGDGGGGAGLRRCRRDDRMSDVGPQISAGVAPPDGKVNISTFYL